MTTLTLGTRGSELALTQANMVQAALQTAWPELEVRREIIKTSGDLRPDLKLIDFSRGDNPVVDKGIFTKELENALKAGSIHVAVHSLKDVPTVLEEGFRISAVLPRAPVEDVLISKTPGGLAALKAGAVVATSSVRRARQLRHVRPDLRVTDIRGNVPTRLRKAAESTEIDAILLAHAGLLRLGLFHPALEEQGVTLYMNLLDPEEFLPAAGQGAVALETWREVPEISALLQTINHQETFLRITAERRFLELLQAGCQTPVGMLTRVEGDRLSLRAQVFPEEEGPPRVAQVSGSVSDPLGGAQALFDALL